MVTVRHIARSELSGFAHLGRGERSPDRLEAELAEMWRSGEGRPEWCFLAEDEDRAVGRLAMAVLPVGCGLDTLEHRVVAPWLADSVEDAEGVVRALLEASVAALPPGTQTLDARLNAESQPDLSAWRDALESSGFTVFQEKQGFLWTDEHGPPSPTPRLRFRTLAEVGGDAYAAAMARGIVGTLDRNDRHYVGLCGPDGWGREMLGYLGPGDDASWLVADDSGGSLVGYVAVSAFDEPVTGTIIHIGVLPEHRGRGYVDELLGAVARVARDRGFGQLLSDVDTENAPMLASMRRAGHSPVARAWHVWHYRLSLG